MPSFARAFHVEEVAMKSNFSNLPKLRLQTDTEGMELSAGLTSLVHVKRIVQTGFRFIHQNDEITKFIQFSRYMEQFSICIVSFENPSGSLPRPMFRRRPPRCLFFIGLLRANGPYVLPMG